MHSFPAPVLWLWAFSVLAQLFVLTLLFSRGNSRRLPLFTAYVALNICQAGFLLFVYSHSWSEPAIPGTLAWTSECLTLLAEAVATHRNSCAYPETIPGYLGPWMAGFDSYLRAGRSSRGSSSSRPLGRGSLVSTRSRLSPHLCNGSYCLPSACPVLFDSRTYRLQNDTWGVLFFIPVRKFWSILFFKGFSAGISSSTRQLGNA